MQPGTYSPSLDCRSTSASQPAPAAGGVRFPRYEAEIRRRRKAPEWMDRHSGFSRVSGPLTSASETCWGRANRWILLAARSVKIRPINVPRGRRPGEPGGRPADHCPAWWQSRPSRSARVCSTGVEDWALTALPPLTCAA